MSQQGPGHHTRAQDKGRPHQVLGQPTFQVNYIFKKKGWNDPFTYFIYDTEKKRLEILLKAKPY